MIEKPEEWEHTSGYHLNSGGKRLTYVHKEKPLEANLETMLNEDENPPILQYFTVIFEGGSGKPRDTIEPHQIFNEKEDAIEHLEDLLEEYA